MKIKKLGHCCLVIEVNSKRIMTDPGSYSTLQVEEKNIDIILITHEHPDHLHVDSLKVILENNKDVKVITNSAVGKILTEAGIAYELLEEGGRGEFEGILFEGYGDHHAEVYEEFGQVQNTGYFIDNTLFYPGDAFTNPHKQVEILALPVAGPWMKIKNAIHYALELKPKVCFPVHDGMIKEDRPGPIYNLPKNILTQSGIEFKVLEVNKEEEL
ncbi:MAG: MBL fold metallo-hydrolase [Patescibacteria group bacterium]